MTYSVMRGVIDIRYGLTYCYSHMVVPALLFNAGTTYCYNFLLDDFKKISQALNSIVLHDFLLEGLNLSINVKIAIDLGQRKLSLITILEDDIVVSIHVKRLAKLNSDVLNFVDNHVVCFLAVDRRIIQHFSVFVNRKITDR